MPSPDRSRGECFADRLRADSFVNDPVVGIYGSDPAEGSAAWVPERLFARLALVARAYELRVLPLLGGSEPLTLNREMIESLIDELDFLQARLCADLVCEWALAIATRALSALSCSESVLTVEASQGGKRLAVVSGRAPRASRRKGPDGCGSAG